MTEACSHQLTVDGQVDYLCGREVGHVGLHRWDAAVGERGREWTNSGLDFLDGPYGPQGQSDGVVCSAETYVEGARVGCTRPVGHGELHGNHHGPHGPELWGEKWGEPNTADFEIVIQPGVATPKEVRLNGARIPKLKSVSVEYEPNEARTVLLELFATSVREVPE